MIRKYQKNDVLKINIQFMQQDEAQFIHNYENINAFTICDEDKILGVFGISRDMENYHNALCYALLSQDLNRKIIELVRFVNHVIQDYMMQNDMQTATFTVKNDFYQAIRLAKLLGFAFKENLPNFYLNNDYKLFERKYKNVCSST